MGLRQGWMEKRQFERIDATVKVTYTVVSKDELVRVMSEPAYRESSMDHLPELSKKSATVHAVTRDISMGGMSLVGTEDFPPDSALQIHLHLPGYPAPVTLLALHFDSWLASLDYTSVASSVALASTNEL